MCCIDSCSQFIQRVKSEAYPELPSLQFCIQFIDESLVEEAVAFMIEQFLPNDNMDKAIGKLKGFFLFATNNERPENSILLAKLFNLWAFLGIKVDREQSLTDEMKR